MLVFLFTDIEGSSQLWEEHTSAMAGAIARHDEILRQRVKAAGGRITKHTGDGITAVFDGGKPLACALETQVRFATEAWGEVDEIRIRAGLHAGDAEFYASEGTPNGDYFGPPVNATARVMSAAWGGQVLLTPAVTQASPLPPHATLLDLGQHLLKSVSDPMQLCQLLHPQLPYHDFPPPRTLSGQSIRNAVDERGGQMATLEPQAIGIALVTATLAPALQGELDPDSGALEGNLGVLEDLGAQGLRGFVATFAQRLLADGPLPAPELQSQLQRELMAQWQAEGDAAVALRSDASRLLQAVHGVDAVMAAATDEVKEALARGLADLGSQFGEFRWMLAGVRDTLAEMRARQALQLALQREQLDLQRQQLVKTNLILHRQQAGPQIAELTVAGEVEDEGPPEVAAADVDCPYKGLAAFEAEDADYFFGREELVAELTARLAGTRFLAVVGPSGSGKSSLVRAGLLPAVWAGALPDSGEWQTLTITPGAHPLNELAARLSILTDDRPAALLQDLEADPRALDLAIRRALISKPEDAKLLLVVDQFEEIFALCRDEEERRAFIDALLYAVEAEGGRTVVVPTIRADFYGRCAEYPALAAQMSDGLLVGPLSEAELRAAIERPAEVVSLRLEPGLADLILDDVSGEPGALPLLSHALLETFARRRGHTLTLSGYAASGGVAGAIAQTADTLYGNLDGDEQALARGIFLRLTELGEEGSQDTRRRAAPAELVRSEEEATRVEALLRTLADARLVTTGEDSVEVAHEALIREWPTLRGWLEEDREGLRIHRHLTEAAQEWQELGREPGELYRGARLAAADEWAQEQQEALNPLERDFLAASREMAEREAAEREAQRQRELEAARALAAEQEKRAQEQARSAGRLRRRALLLAGAMGVAVILAVVALFAFGQANQSAGVAQAASTQAVSERYAAETAQALEADQRATAEAEGWARATQQAVAEAEAEARATQQAVAETEAQARATQQAIAEEQKALAEAQTRLATSRELANAAVASLDEDPERSALLAMEALEFADTLEARNALRRALPEIRILHTMPIPDLSSAIAYSPDGALVAAAVYGESGGVWIWDTDTGEELLVLRHGVSAVPRIEFSPDGALLVASGETQLVGWELRSDPNTGAVSATEAFRLTGYLANSSGMFEQAINWMSFSPDGTRLAVAHWKGAPTVFDVATMAEILRLEGHAITCRDAEYSPDGELLVTICDDGLVKTWDAASGQELLTLVGHSGTTVIRSADFSPDGTRLVTAEEGGTLFVWDPFTGQKLLTLLSDYGSFFRAYFSPDGRSLVGAMSDGTVRVWDAASGGLLRTYAGHTGSVQDAAISPDGRQLASAGTDGTAKLWTTALVGEDSVFSIGAGAVALRLDYSPDSKYLAVNNFLGQASVWDPAAGEPVVTLPPLGQPGGTSSVDFSPDGSHLAVGTMAGPIQIWDVASRELETTLRGHTGGAFEVSFSPDGKRLGSAGFDGRGLVWDLAIGQPITLTHDDPTLPSITFSPDGKRVATASAMEEQSMADRGVYEWDATTGELLRFLHVETYAVYTVRYSPDGQFIAAGIQEGDVLVWQASSGEVVHRLKGHTGLVVEVAFSPDGQWLASSAKDDTAKLWDVATGEELATFYGQTGGQNGIAYSPDGTRIATGSNPGIVRTYVLDTEDLVALARSRLTRSLTTEECQQYLHVEECPERP
jgi:WD40 repeat protein/class 3 adenylate cyclase